MQSGQSTEIGGDNPIDLQDNGSIESFYKTSQTFPALSAPYEDYGLDNLGATTNDTTDSNGNVIYNDNQPLDVYTKTDVPIPKWCNYIIAIVIGGGGWINNGRSNTYQKTDNDYTSGSGGSGGMIAWKSPELIHTTDTTYTYDIKIEKGRQGQIGKNGFTYNGGQYPGNGGSCECTVKKNNTSIGSCEATGGHQSNWVTGNDDDDTYGSTLIGGVGGGNSNTGGTVLYPYRGIDGSDGVGGYDKAKNPNDPNDPTHGFDDGTTTADNQLAHLVNGWSNAGRGAYWATGDNIETTPSGYNYLHAARIEGGSNGAIRVYFIADI